MSGKHSCDCVTKVAAENRMGAIVEVCEDYMKGVIMDFVTKDSGERQEFSTGMVRDTSTDKVRYDLVYMPMFKRWAELMTRGAKKYSPNNWLKAETQEEMDRFRESAFRHFMTWFLDEDRTEDHAAAIFFNVSGAEMVREKLQNKLPDIRQG